MKTRTAPYGTLRAFADLVAQLAKAPRTYVDLRDATGLSDATVLDYVGALREAGMVRVHSRRHNPKGGPAALVFTLQASPFAEPDAPPVAPTPRPRIVRRPKAPPAPPVGAITSVWGLARQ